MEFKICSSAFPDGGYLPGWYSSSGLNASPPFGWAEAPPGTESLALICRSSSNTVHWVLWNIPPDRKTIYGRLPTDRDLPQGIHQGVNDLLSTGWTGPIEKAPDLSLLFELYALDKHLTFSEKDVTASMLLYAMKGHVLGEASVNCVFS